MNRTALLIMAAGLGSRFGGGVKQLTPIGPNDEIIMDYSVHDAIQAGFDKIIFVIRRDIEEDFRERIGVRVEKICAAHGVEIGYAYQDLHAIPGAFPEGRTKPWGTGHAVLAAKALIDCPFAVINADDYYGKSAYRQLHDYLAANEAPTAYAMAGFILKNTLSDNGGVTRGMCAVENGFLTDVVETKDIVKTPGGAASGDAALDLNAHVSMNMWGLTKEFVALLEEGFEEFFREMREPLKDEFLLPVFIGRLLREKRVSVRVLETADHWFGVTYHEDRQTVVDEIAGLIRCGEYPQDLYGDL